MYLGVIGRKCGMTHIFSDSGDFLPVTVVHIEPNRVTQIKELKKHGYCSLQITTGTVKKSRINMPLMGHFSKIMVNPGRGLWEFRVLNYHQLQTFNKGDLLDISLFKSGQKIDITSYSKGKGFQGVVKRHHFKTQDASHGNSLSHRVHGSTGQNQTPGRVFKNKKMAGHMGNVKVTIQSLKIVKVDYDNALLLIKGGIPGPKNCDVILNAAVKFNKL